MKTKKKFLSLSLALLMLASTMFQTQWMDVYAEPVGEDTVIDTEQELRDAVDAGGNVVLGGDIDLSTAVEVTKDVVLDLNGKTLTVSTDTIGDGVFLVTGGTLTINGDGTIDGVGQNDYNMALWANGGNIIINGGHYTNVGITGTDDHYDLIYAKNGSTITINGGSFECKTPKWTLNCHDSSGAQIIVKGGTFKDYNPSEVYTEPDQPKNFLPEGFEATVDENDNFVVKEETIGCSVCGRLLTYREEVPASCEHAGFEAHYACDTEGCENRNSILFKDAEGKIPATYDELVIPTSGHNKSVQVFPGCGNTEEYRFKVCDLPGCLSNAAFDMNDNPIVLEDVPTLAGHKLTKHDEETATCTTPGKQAYYSCEKCEKLFIDIKFPTTITEEELIVAAPNHTWSETYSKDETHHWRECLNGPLHQDGVVKELHNYDQEVIKEELWAGGATCTTGPLYYKTCVCGAVGTETFADQNGQKAPHNMSTTLSFNENEHFYECEAEGCTYKEGNAAHKFDLAVIDEKFLAAEATCEELAKYFMSCECGAHNDVTFDDMESVLQECKAGKELFYDDEVDADKHFNKCEVCEKPMNHATHEFVEGTVLENATVEKEGTREDKCECGKTKLVAIPKLEVEEHECVKGTVLVKGETTHWFQCTKENCEERIDEKAHVFDKEVETDDFLAVKGNCETKTTYFKSCECGAKGTETFESAAELKHNFDKEVATEDYLATAATCVKKATYFKSCVCGAKGTETFEAGELSTTHDVDKTALLKDGTNHWYACKVEGCEYKEDLATHVFDKEVATADFEASKATCQAKAQYYKSCVCGKAGTDKFESGELAKHVMGTNYEKDETGHWTKCTTTGCTEKSKVEDHVFKDGKTKCETCGYEKTHVCELKAVDAKKATCEKVGNIAHYKCTECSKLYKDKDGKEELKEEDVIVAKTEHKNTWFITKAATKDKVGEIKGKCSVCGTTTKIDLEKLGTSGKLTVGSDDDNEFDAELATEDAYMLVELTTDEVKEINDGKGLNILLTVEDLDKDITKSEKEDMEDAMKEEKLTLGKYLDITLTKQILDGKKVEDSEAVEETSDDVEIVFELTDALLNKDDKVTRTYKVLRLHDGKVTVIDAEFDKDDKTVTFETDEFSTYALAYQDKDKDGKVVETEKAESNSGTVMPDAGDNMDVILYALAAGLSMAALVGYFVYNKKKNVK